MLNGAHHVAHNRAFDERMLRQSCLRHHLTPLAMASPLNNGHWPALQLATLAGVLANARPHYRHRALADADACHKLRARPAGAPPGN